MNLSKIVPVSHEHAKDDLQTYTQEQLIALAVKLTETNGALVTDGWFRASKFTGGEWSVELTFRSSENAKVEVRGEDLNFERALIEAIMLARGHFME